MASALEPTHGTGAFMGYLTQGPDGSLTPEDAPKKMGNSYTDFLATWTALSAIMASLIHRARSGRGMWIDLAMYQVGAAFMGEGLLDYAHNGRSTRRMGNRHPSMVPHGCYPCRGNDRWCAIAVSTDEEWKALCRVVGKVEWLEDTRFTDPLSRWQHRETLDNYMAEITREWDAHQLMDALQGEGVPAGALFDSKDLLVNPHLKERKFYEVTPHHPSTGMPPLPYAGRPWKLSETPAVPGKAAPIMGEHNQLVLTELLGYSGEELAKLEAEGVIGYAPTSARGVQRPSLDEQVRQGRLQRYETDYAEVVEREYGSGTG
jgi:benzylsuccinate CoA-transferase BbsF subunit